MQTIQARLIQRNNSYAVEVTERGEDDVVMLLHTGRAATVGVIEGLLGRWGFERTTAWEPVGGWLSTARLRRYTLV